VRKTGDRAGPMEPGNDMSVAGGGTVVTGDVRSNITRRAFVKGVVAAAGASAAATASRADSQEDEMADEAPIQTRIFWTWDHCTTWALNRPGGHDLGASNEYGRAPETFLADYTCLLRWCGQHGIDGVVVWGLLRDRHGGADAVHRLCEVARECDVMLLAGVGLNAYGGVYYEGASDYSLERHLQAHPELYGLRPNGDRMVFDFGTLGPHATHHACPSRPENQAFTQESLRWLFETFDLAGVQMEAGDTGVCRCPQCEARREHPVSGFSWDDMALMYPLAAAAVRSVREDACIIAETYSHPQPYEGEAEAPGFGEGVPPWAAACIAQFPENVFAQWVCDQWVAPHNAVQWTDAGVPPAGPRRNIMRAHFSTYWHRFRHELAVDWIADMVAKSVGHDFDGISLFGESSPFHAGAELNYLALADYGSGDNPEADLDSFLTRVAGPLLGGPDLAREYLGFARLIDARQEIPAALTEMRRIAAGLDGRPAQRWVWLANYLASFIYPEPPLGTD